MTHSREAFVVSITAERARQDVEFGGTEHDDHLGRSQWCDFIEKQIGLAREAETLEEVAERFVKIGALACAGFEAAERSSTRPGFENMLDNETTAILVECDGCDGQFIESSLVLLGDGNRVCRLCASDNGEPMESTAEGKG